MGREGLRVTTELNIKPAAGAVAAEAPRKGRSGSETRKRTERMTLRLLPQEQQVVQLVADEFGMPSIQALIVDALQPLMSPDALAALSADRMVVRALAEERGLTHAQALILHALASTSPSKAAS